MSQVNRALVVIIAVIASIVLAGCSPTPAPFPTTPTPGTSSLMSGFQIVSLEGRWMYGTYTCYGEMRNNNTVAAIAEVQCIARDASGTLVDSEKFYPTVANIAPGGTIAWHFGVSKQTRAVSMEAKVVNALVDRW